MSILAVWALTEVWSVDSSRRSARAWALVAGICGGLAVLSRTTAMAILAASGLFGWSLTADDGSDRCSSGARWSSW